MLKNIVINGVSDQLVLSSNEGDFHCPQAFKALQVSYTRDFSFPTYPNEAAGWESISLPFVPAKITHEDGRVLAPFDSNVEGAKPFWLRRMTSGGFADVTQIEACTPYIIAMPNNEKYAAEYRITGKVTFSAEDFNNGVLIPATESLPQEEGPAFKFCASYGSVLQSSSVYALNRDTDDSRKAGSLFCRNLRDTRPFEPYVINKNIATSFVNAYPIGNYTVNTRGTRTIGSVPSISDM